MTVEEVRQEKEFCFRFLSKAQYGVAVVPSALERVKLMDDIGEIAVILDGWHDPVFAIVRAEEGDAGHQGGGEIPATGVSD